MLIFFDYLYYGIYKMYNNSSDSSPEFAASCAVAGFQAFNILSLIMSYGIIDRNGEINISKLLAVIVLVVLIIVNYIRYIQIDRFNHGKIKAKWDMKTPQHKVIIRSLLVSYVIISAVIFFGLIAYVASKKI